MKTIKDISDMFDTWYDVYSSDVLPFGKHWCGGKKFIYGEPKLIAKYPKTNEDGQDVEVYCTAVPTRFHTIVTLPGPNSVGKHKEGYKVETGSSCENLVVELAMAIAGGRIGFSPNKPDEIKEEKS